MPALVPTQPAIQYVPGAISLEVKRQRLKLMIHLHLVAKLKMVELKLHFPMFYDV
jgi:hypothetical protein